MDVVNYNDGPTEVRKHIFFSEAFGEDAAHKPSVGVQGGGGGRVEAPARDFPQIIMERATGRRRQPASLGA